MQKRIDELNDYSTPKEISPTTMLIKDMCKMSLKDLEITQLKEGNQEIKYNITTEESEDSIEEIRILKYQVTRFEESVVDRIPLQGDKNFLWDVVIKEIPSLEKHLVMVDEHKKVAMVARRRCKALQELLAQSPREEA